MARMAILTASALSFLGAVDADCTSNVPYFPRDWAGLDCARATEACRCSEGFVWEAVEEATYYAVARRPLDEELNPAGFWSTVGDTRWLIWPERCAGGGDCPDVPLSECPVGCVMPARHATFWLVAWDDPVPAAGRLYEYSVTSCDDRGCGSRAAVTVVYRGAPYLVLPGS
jgi:hypothetical protein